jgi:lysophospholipase-3
MRHLIMPLVLMLATLLFAGKTTSVVVAHGEATTSGLHPVILLPGLSCSQFDARLTDEYEPPTPGCGVTKQGRGWFRLWENYTAVQADPSLLQCYQDQIRLVYDRAAGDYRNAPGVDTRIVSFGTTRSFYFDDPGQKYVRIRGSIFNLFAVAQALFRPVVVLH